MTYRVNHSIYKTPAYGDRVLVSSLDRSLTDPELRNLIAETVLAAMQVRGRHQELTYFDDIYTHEGRLWIEGNITWKEIQE